MNDELYGTALKIGIKEVLKKAKKSLTIYEVTTGVMIHYKKIVEGIALNQLRQRVRYMMNDMVENDLLTKDLKKSNSQISSYIFSIKDNYGFTRKAKSA